jgi:hypothetical protein
MLTMNDIMEYTKNENVKYLVIEASHGNDYGFNLKVKKERTYAKAAWQWRRCGGGAGVEQDRRRRWQHLGGGGGRVAGVAAVLAQQLRSRRRQRQHGGGGGGSRAVAAQRWQRSGGSVTVVAVRRQRGDGQRGGSVGQWGGRTVAGSMAAVLAARRRWHWQHAGGGRLGGCGEGLEASQHQRRQQSGRSCTATAHCHGGKKDTGGNSNGGGTTNNQQSTKSSSSNGNGNDDNNNK